MKIKIANLIENKYDFVIAFIPTIIWAKRYDGETENIMFTWLGLAVFLIIKE